MRELPKDLGSQVHAAIREDVGTGDVTAGFVPENQLAHGRVITREAAVMCGRPWVEEVFRQIDEGVRLRWHANDGERISPAQNLFDIEGSARSILTGERTALNFCRCFPLSPLKRGVTPKLSLARAARSWIPARRCPGFARRRSTLLCAGARRTIAWGSMTWFS